MLKWIRWFRWHLKIEDARVYAEKTFDVTKLTISGIGDALEHRQWRYALVARIERDKPNIEELRLLVAIFLLEIGTIGNWDKAFEIFRELRRHNLVRHEIFQEFVRARRKRKVQGQGKIQNKRNDIGVF